LTRAARWRESAIWLFAFAAIVAGVPVERAAAGLGGLASNALFALVAFGAAWTGVFFTRATASQGAFAFLAGAFAAAAAAFALVWHRFAGGAAAVTGGVDSPLARLSTMVGKAVTALYGTGVSLIVLAVFFGAGLAGSIAGALHRKKVLSRRQP
jgi:hypothetical protein